MRIRINFGLHDGTEIITWFRLITDFPKLLKYQGNVYEFDMYDRDPTMQNDYIFYFHLTKNYTVNFYDIPSFNDLFRFPLDSRCVCGAKWDRGNPNWHMFYCPKWRPMGEKK